jgi:hypothetical protein
MSAERKNHGLNDQMLDRIIGEDDRGCECYTDSSKAKARDELTELRADNAALREAVNEARSLLTRVMHSAYRAQDWSGTRLGDDFDEVETWLTAHTADEVKT